MPTLRQYRYLCAVADHGHFGRAAEAVHVSQPALSMQIREIEAELGLTLVERGRRGAVLTAEGQAVAARARALLAAAQDLEAFAEAHREDRARRLALGVIPTIAPYLMPRLLPVLEAQIPGLVLTLRETRTEALVRELESGDLDAIIAAAPIAGADLTCAPLFEDRFLLASDGREPPPSRPQDLPPERLLLLEEGHCLRDQALTACALSAPQARAAFGATSLTTLLQLVAHGYGVTLAPEMAAHEIADPRIVLSRFSEPQPSRTVVMAWRAAAPGARRWKALAQAVRQAGPFAARQSAARAGADGEICFP